jgi:hypothetical protein
MSRKRRQKDKANTADAVTPTAGERAEATVERKPFRSGRGVRSRNRSPNATTDPRNDSMSVKPQMNQLQQLRNDLIVPGYGMSIPAFRRYSDSDAQGYIPLGIEHGYYTPVGQEATSELYPQLGNLFLQRVLTRLTNLGYENDYTVKQLRTYFNGVALGLQMVRFITELRTLQKYGEIHSSSPVTAFCTTALNGKLVAQHRRAIKLIASLPFDPKWEEAYVHGFGMTTMSDSPFGPLRMFAPKNFQPEGPGSEYSASSITIALQEALDSFISDQTNVELASTLSVIYPPRPELPEVLDTYFGYNAPTVNNLLNLPYNDGTTTAPAFSDTETVRYFYRRKVVEHGMYTYAPDNDVFAVLQGTVWTRRLSALEDVRSSFAVDNTAAAQPVVADEELWSMYGRVWNSNIALIDSPQPSVAHVYTTFTSVATGVADAMLNG